MKFFHRQTLFLLASILVCGSIGAHPRPETPHEWISNIESLNKVEKKITSLAIDLKTAGDRTLIDATVKKFPHLQELKIYSFPHEINPGLFESLAKLKKLTSLEVSGDAILSEKDFELIGTIVSLKHLHFSLP